MEKGVPRERLTDRRACLLGLLLLTAASANEEAVHGQQSPTIHVSRGRYGSYYHLLLTLRAADFELTVPADQRVPRYDTENRYAFSAEGQFEIFVRKEAFGLPAPKCARYIIVRMPATDPSTRDATDKLKRKRALFDAIERLKRSGGSALDVAIELNPYVHVVSRDPLRLQLTQCNVFFRQAAGSYVDHVGPL